MELIEIIRWVSIVLLWFCIALNWWCIIRSSRFRKKQEKLLEETDAVYRAYVDLRDRYIRLLEEKGVVLDEGNVDDNGCR